VAFAALLLTSCVSALSAGGVVDAAEHGAASVRDEVRVLFQKWHQQFERTYKAGEEEFELRLRIFEDNLRYITEYNAKQTGVTLGLNAFADLSHEEFKSSRLGYSYNPAARQLKSTGAFRYANVAAPDAIDWREKNAVTPIKNQGQCGSCWAFSATEAIESKLILATGGKYNIELSPQQITSCTPSNGTYGCLGCNGGFTEGAYEYLTTVTGLSNSFFIPYAQSLTETTETEACPTAKVDSLDGPLKELQGGYAVVSGYSYATPPCTDTCLNQDLQKLAAALEESPVSVCVNAGTWNDYTGGVLTAAACGDMGIDAQDHCVGAVGFNTTAPTPYWIVRNSWASTWGEQGYIYLEMAKNTCGLADDATIPEVKVYLSEAESKEAAARKEAMYRRATGAMNYELTETVVVV